MVVPQKSRCCWRAGGALGCTARRPLADPFLFHFLCAECAPLSLVRAPWPCCSRERGGTDSSSSSFPPPSPSPCGSSRRPASPIGLEFCLPACPPGFQAPASLPHTHSSGHSGVGQAHCLPGICRPLQVLCLLLKHRWVEISWLVPCNGQRHFCLVMNDQLVVNKKGEKKEMTQAAKMLTSLSKSKHYCFFPTLLRDFVLTVLLVISHLWKNSWILN